MARYTRNSAILLKLESPRGVDAEPTGAANAMLVSDLSVARNFNNVDRSLVRNFLGASEQLPGTRSVGVSFTVELWGSGTAGTAPAWDAAIRCCGWARTITSGVMVEYTPATMEGASGTIYYYDSGLLHKVVGFRGHGKLGLGMGDRPTLRVEGIGLAAGLVVQDNPDLTVSDFIRPEAIHDASAQDIRLGSSYAALTGAVTGGTVYKSRGLQVDLGERVEHVPLLGGDQVEIVDREVTATFELQLTATEERSIHIDYVQTAAPVAISFTMGEVAGERLSIYAPTAQILNPKAADYQGLRLTGYDIRCLPVDGADDLIICLR